MSPICLPGKYKTDRAKTHPRRSHTHPLASLLNPSNEISNSPPGGRKKKKREKKIQQHRINLSTRRFNATIYILRERKRCHRRVVEKEKEEATNSGAEGRGLPWKNSLHVTLNENLIILQERRSAPSLPLLSNSLFPAQLENLFEPLPIDARGLIFRHEY